MLTVSSPAASVGVQREEHLKGPARALSELAATLLMFWGRKKSSGTLYGNLRR